MTQAPVSTEVAEVPLVLHVIPTPAPRGAQRSARDLADLLDSPGRCHHRVLSLVDAPTGFVVDTALRDPNGTTETDGFDPRLGLRLRRALSGMDPDVVVAHGSDPLKYLVPAMVMRRRPLVYTAIGTYSGSRGELQLWLWRHLLDRADRIAAVGEEVREQCIDLLRVPPDHVALAPHGRDPEVFHPRRDSSRRVPMVIFVGALTTGKCPDQFVKVVAGFRDRGIAAEARIVGTGPLEQAIAGPARAAGVEMLGARSDVAELLRDADLLVFPSRPAGEGMPGVLIEAALSGLPVVATAVPGVRAIVQDGRTGFIVPVDDVSALVDRTSALLCDPRRRASFGEAARAHALAHFTLTEVIEFWQPLLEGLLGARTEARTGRGGGR